jgi:hypothetical protein
MLEKTKAPEKQSSKFTAAIPRKFKEDKPRKKKAV